MSIREKYWFTVLFMFCRYISIVLMGSCVGFILAGYYINPWFYAGLAVWPLFLMWGIVNIRYIHALTKKNKLEFSKILENAQ